MVKWLACDESKARERVTHSRQLGKAWRHQKVGEHLNASSDKADDSSTLQRFHESGSYTGGIMEHSSYPETKVVATKANCYNCRKRDKSLDFKRANKPSLEKGLAQRSMGKHGKTFFLILRIDI